MKSVKRERIVWEEITGDPCIYRIYAAGSERNTYLFLEGKEALVIDPRSGYILRSVCRLARGLGAGQDGIQVFLTDACGNEMCEMIRSLPDGMRLFCAAQPACLPDEDADCSVPKEAGSDTEVYLSGDVETDADALSSGKIETAEGMPIRSWTRIGDGDTIRIGSRLLCVIGLEGCRKGQTGLWFPEKGVLFSGEAAGCGYLPDVEDWDPKMDTLGLQIEALRRMMNLAPQCILTGCGMPAGVDDLPDPGSCFTGEEIDDTDGSYGTVISSAGPVIGNENERRIISPECAEILNEMLSNYCLRILEVYQKIPVRGTIREEKLIRPESDGESASTISCLKYLLCRKYVRRHETQDGYLYERGSLRLTDWLATSHATQ